MIIATHGILASQLAGFDADAQAFFDRVTTAGGSLSATEKTAVNTLVLDLKSYSIWSKMKAIYPMVGASAAACSQNLKSSSFTGTFNGGWTYASTGITPNGTTGYMDTGINDLNDLGTNATISVYLNGGTSSIGWNLGVFNGSVISGISVNRGSTENFVNIRSGITSNFTEAFSNALYTGTNNGTNNVIYKNATSKATVIQTTTGINLKHFIGTLNQNGSAGNFYSSARFALACFANDTFSSTNMTDFNTSVQSFQTTLSRA